MPARIVVYVGDTPMEIRCATCNAEIEDEDDPCPHGCDDLEQSDEEEVRKSCSLCDAEIGYGLCLKCNLRNAKTDLIFSEDEADEVYSRGLVLARNGEKHDALEVWLPLAMSGDSTTIGAVIATLWSMVKVAEAKTWIVRLAEIDLEGLEALAGRLNVPFSEFERYAAEGSKL